MLNPKTMKTLVCIVYWHPEPSYLNLGLVHNGINPIQPDLPRFRTARPEPHVRVSLARAPIVKMAGTHVSMAAQKGAIFFGISSPSRCLRTPAARRRRWTWKDSPSSAPASASPTRTRRGPSLGTPRASIVLVGFALVLCGFWVRLVWFFDCVVCDRIWASGGFGGGFFFFLQIIWRICSGFCEETIRGVGRCSSRCAGGMRRRSIWCRWSSFARRSRNWLWMRVSFGFFVFMGGGSAWLNSFFLFFVYVDLIGCVE